MSWKAQFLLGRPGAEYLFDINPAALNLSDEGVVVMHENIAGDLKQSVRKISRPVIQISSTYLTLAQRNQFASLVGIADTFLSFQIRDDLQVTDELVTIIDATHVQIANSSATRLSAYLVALGLSSTITIVTPFKVSATNLPAWGSGDWGAGTWDVLGGGGTFDPGAVTYDDATRIITLTNPITDLTVALYVTYTYTGWLMKMTKMSHKSLGGWLDRFPYDFELQGV